MDLVQLAAGRRIEGELNDLKAHLERVNALNKEEENSRQTLRVDSTRPVSIHAHRNGCRDDIYLKPQFLNLEEVLLVYKARLEKKIAELEIEFKQL